MYCEGFDLATDSLDVHRILSDSVLVELLCPEATRSAKSVAVFREWTQTLGEDDHQMVIRSDYGALRGCSRVKQQALTYFVEREFWGRGYGKYLLDYSVSTFLTTNRRGPLEAVVDRQNMPSRRLLKSVGFVFSGIVPGIQIGLTFLRYTRL